MIKLKEINSEKDIDFQNTLWNLEAANGMLKLAAAVERSEELERLSNRIQMHIDLMDQKYGGRE